jgi:hypothetical protein
MAFDRQGRLFISSDLSGEIYVIVKDEASKFGTSKGNEDTPKGSAGTPSGSGGKASDAQRLGQSFTMLVAASLLVYLLS